MKKLLLFAMIISAFVACNSKKSAEEAEQMAMQDATRHELEEAIANRDSLLSLVNQIAAGMDRIRSMENILSQPGEGAFDVRTKIMDDIAAVQLTLQQRKEQLAALEEKLGKSNFTNSQLRATIETLRAQIDEQAAEIVSLKASLEDANTQIAQLSSQVDNLNNVVDTIKSQRNEAINRSRRLNDELNTCYYVAASSKELKEHNILQGGFLKKTKVMEGDFDLGFFTKANKAVFTVLPLYSKKAKVLTNQPAGSYEIVDENGQKVLRVLDTKAFWSLSNFLVVEIN